VKTAGYSGTPLAKKLGIKEGAKVLLRGAPKGFAVPDLPAGATVGTRSARELDVALLFATERLGLVESFASIAAGTKPNGGIWICWPKKASKVPTDITEDALREDLLGTGWVDNKVCAVSEVWSGLRFVLRKENR
jgi:hypothetical protein